MYYSFLPLVGIAYHVGKTVYSKFNRIDPYYGLNLFNYEQYIALDKDINKKLNGILTVNWRPYYNLGYKDFDLFIQRNGDRFLNYDRDVVEAHFDEWIRFIVAGEAQPNEQIPILKTFRPGIYKSLLHYDNLKSSLIFTILYHPAVFAIVDLYNRIKSEANRFYDAYDAVHKQITSYANTSYDYLKKTDTVQAFMGYNKIMHAAGTKYRAAQDLIVSIKIMYDGDNEQCIAIKGIKKHDMREQCTATLDQIDVIHEESLKDYQDSLTDAHVIIDKLLTSYTNTGYDAYDTVHKQITSYANTCYDDYNKSYNLITSYANLGYDHLKKTDIVQAFMGYNKIMHAADKKYRAAQDLIASIKIMYGDNEQCIAIKGIKKHDMREQCTATLDQIDVIHEESLIDYNNALISAHVLIVDKLLTKLITSYANTYHDDYNKFYNLITSYANVGYDYLKKTDTVQAFMGYNKIMHAAGTKYRAAQDLIASIKITYDGDNEQCIAIKGIKKHDMREQCTATLDQIDVIHEESLKDYQDSLTDAHVIIDKLLTSYTNIGYDAYNKVHNLITSYANTYYYAFKVYKQKTSYFNVPYDDPYKVQKEITKEITSYANTGYDYLKKTDIVQAFMGYNKIMHAAGTKYRAAQDLIASIKIMYGDNEQCIAIKGIKKHDMREQCTATLDQIDVIHEESLKDYQDSLTDAHVIIDKLLTNYTNIIGYNAYNKVHDLMMISASSTSMVYNFVQYSKDNFNTVRDYLQKYFVLNTHIFGNTKYADTSKVYTVNDACQAFNRVNKAIYPDQDLKCDVNTANAHEQKGFVQVLKGYTTSIWDYFKQTDFVQGVICNDKELRFIYQVAKKDVFDYYLADAYHLLHKYYQYYRGNDIFCKAKSVILKSNLGEYSFVKNSIDENHKTLLENLPFIKGSDIFCKLKEVLEKSGLVKESVVLQELLKDDNQCSKNIHDNTESFIDNELNWTNSTFCPAVVDLIGVNDIVALKITTYLSFH